MAARYRDKRAAALSLAGLLGLLAGCTATPETTLLDAYLAPPPLWRGMPEPEPVPLLNSELRLVGMDPGDLHSVFGDPALVRFEGSVQYWRYTFAGCSLDLFVNAPAGGATEIVYYELRPEIVAASDRPAAADCERFGRHLDDGGRRSLPRVESF